MDDLELEGAREAILLDFGPRTVCDRLELLDWLVFMDEARDCCEIDR